MKQGLCSWFEPRSQALSLLSGESLGTRLNLHYTVAELTVCQTCCHGVLHWVEKNVPLLQNPGYIVNPHTTELYVLFIGQGSTQVAHGDAKIPYQSSQQI